MSFGILFVVFTVALEITAHVTAHVTAAPTTTTHGLTTTTQFPLRNTIDDATSTWQLPQLPGTPVIQIADEGDNDEPPERPGFTDPDAAPPSTVPVSASVSLTAGHEAEPMSTATPTRSGTLSTEYLSQVPRAWPYTKFGLGRRKETATWSLTNGDGEIVGVVKHEVLWYPRPLWTGATTLLDGWKPTFVVTNDIGPAITTASDEDRSIG